MPSASAIAVLHGARSFDGAVSGTGMSTLVQEAAELGDATGRRLSGVHRTYCQRGRDVRRLHLAPRYPFTIGLASA